jgi:hypothetical protein
MPKYTITFDEHFMYEYIKTHPDTEKEDMVFIIESDGESVAKEKLAESIISRLDKSIARDLSSQAFISMEGIKRRIPDYFKLFNIDETTTVNDILKIDDNHPLIQILNRSCSDPGKDVNDMVDDEYKHYRTKQQHIFENFLFLNDEYKKPLLLWKIKRHMVVTCLQDEPRSE